MASSLHLLAFPLENQRMFWAALLLPHISAKLPSWRTMEQPSTHKIYPSLLRFTFRWPLLGPRQRFYGRYREWRVRCKLGLELPNWV